MNYEIFNKVIIQEFSNVYPKAIDIFLLTLLKENRNQVN